jgi:hypothetical protein
MHFGQRRRAKVLSAASEARQRKFPTHLSSREIFPTDAPYSSREENMSAQDQELRRHRRRFRRRSLHHRMRPRRRRRSPAAATVTTGVPPPPPPLLLSE